MDNILHNVHLRLCVNRAEIYSADTALLYTTFSEYFHLTMITADREIPEMKKSIVKNHMIKFKQMTFTNGCQHNS